MSLQNKCPGCVSSPPFQSSSPQQQIQARIHQSLRPHANIVTLYRTLETSQFLLLLSEYVHGQDLFSFIEQGRDNCGPDTGDNPSGRSFPQTQSTATVLSQPRLRLISSMFSQMCEAVAACHDQQVFHRGLKPESFIVHDEQLILDEGRYELEVKIKLTDFGLSTTDLSSSDMDCGSAPYMSYGLSSTIFPGVSLLLIHHTKHQNAEIMLPQRIALVLPMSGHWVSCSSTCQLRTPT